MYVYKYVCVCVSRYECMHVCVYVLCMYVCVCKYVWMYACMYVCTNVYMYYVCMFVRMCVYVCVYVRMHVCIYVLCMYVCITYVCVCMYACMYICMCVCTYVCMYVCMCVRMYICMYVYVCVYECMYLCLFCLCLCDCPPFLFMNQQNDCHETSCTRYTFTGNLNVVTSNYILSVMKTWRTNEHLLAATEQKWTRFMGIYSNEVVSSSKYLSGIRSVFLDIL